MKGFSALNIAVLAGGYSHERDVSLTSASLIANALIDEGHKVCLCDVYLGHELDEKDNLFTDEKRKIHKIENSVPDLDSLKKESGNGDALIGKNVLDICRMADVVFLALHGSMGENGQLQATLDNFGIKYTGSGYVGSLLAMDKDISKKLFKFSGVVTPEWIRCDKDTSTDEIVEKIGFPCVVKPTSSGSSVGISLVSDRDGLDTALALAKKYEDSVIVEKQIIGREFTVGVLDGEVLPIIEIIPTEGFYDYENKYQAGKTLEICPAEISESLKARLSEQTLLAFDALRLSGYARFDFISDKDENTFCLEANTLPGMTPTSLLPQMAAAIGISYGNLCTKIIETALK